MSTLGKEVYRVALAGLAGLADSGLGFFVGQRTNDGVAVSKNINLGTLKVLGKFSFA